MFSIQRFLIGASTNFAQRPAAIEVQESVDVLAGGGPADVVELTLALAREMLAGAGRDDVAGRHGAGQRLAGARRLVADELGGAEGALQPVGDGVLVTHRPRQGADDDEPEQDAAPQEQRAGVGADDALVDRLAHRGGEERLADEPHDAEGDSDDEGAPLPLADPPQVCRGAGQVGRAGIGVGQ